MLSFACPASAALAHQTLVKPAPTASRAAAAPSPARLCRGPLEQTLALFYTESEYVPGGTAGQSQWMGRVQAVEAKNPHVPRTIADACRPSGLAVDSLSRRVYWTDSGSPSIRCNSFDGSKRSALGTGMFGRKMGDGPFGITVDPTTDTVAWSAMGHAAIHRSSLDGAGIALRVAEDRSAWSASGPWGLALYLRPGCAHAHAPEGMHSQESLGAKSGVGRVYWTSWGRIRCSEMGSDVATDVVSKGLIDPTGLAIDPRTERIFWTDPKAGKVQCASLDGTRVCDVATGLAAPWGLALGPTHLFWTDRERGTIQSCSLKNGVVQKALSGLHAPEGLAIFNGPTRAHGAPSVLADSHGAHGDRPTTNPVRRVPTATMSTARAGRRVRARDPL